MIAFALQFGCECEGGVVRLGLGSHLDLHSHLLLINFVCKRRRRKRKKEQEQEGIGTGEAKRRKTY